ncbi:hypothetical protein GGTG_04152 [Gaeumannomyces tritici R3-111a-1]|uniref:DUF323 domain-containing protein n=1 Tax=Gaeumannomyces tritici (strain R3-111a-1) TaxID=644352 RepID=J3NSA7_GAET3|nr:hypothetical protein GGTG_04152 [Gaeumannomyces tritici R3-111a-1]EJT79063.1 hypothetical protein GGTG_04152 [Gaeumannomyces tritici R3-111a-1]
MPPAAELELRPSGGVADPLEGISGKPFSVTPKLKPGHGFRETNGGRPESRIIDIRAAGIETNLKAEIVTLFRPKAGPRVLPTILLYDQRGLQLFEEITYLDEYYLTNDEISVLETSSAEIAKEIPDGSMIIELGSGNLRKVSILLRALDDAGKSVDYYALDLSEDELKRTLAQVPHYKHVRCHGLLGTYDDGQEWLRSPANLGRQKCILFLGSSIGNFRRDEASEFLRGFSQALRPGDSMLIGVDSCYDPGRIYDAYNDSKGVTHQFILNGLVHANRILGEEAFHVADWRVIGEYVYDDQGGRHQAWYTPIRDTWAMGQLVPVGERVFVERSVKFTPSDREKLWRDSGVAEAGRWAHGTEYGLHLLAKPNMPFSLSPSDYAPSALPSLADWRELWAAWDSVTRGMLPKKELLEKPIRLRNACIFYLGHIPTFLDIQLTKTTRSPATEPQYYYSIFERGIDPDVDNPEKCHAHSEIPGEWPPAAEIARYQERVRARLQGIYAAGERDIPRSVGRAIWVGFEHEAMHLETLLYMLLQSDKALPPPGSRAPDFEQLAAKAEAGRVTNQWFEIPATELTIGLDDPESGTDLDRDYGWDNEKPARLVKVGAFQAQARPITNEEYAKYMYHEGVDRMPASWVAVGTEGSAKGTAVGINGTTNGQGPIDKLENGLENGHTNGDANGHVANRVHGCSLPASFTAGKAVRTVYGPVPLKFALDWPVSASYDELSGCAAWMGGRIPTFEEARSIYEHAQVLQKDAVDRELARKVPAVNGHLSNDGVEETPPSRAAGPGGDEPRPDGRGLFVDLAGANVGLQQWHPAPVTGDGARLAGQAQMGGVWEWTSSPLERHNGFEPMELYPNYTADFFDGKHNIVLGGSWATIPRIAGRKSFINWYQRNYPYVWAGARLVRDVPV